jgi:hypothetical protein
MSRPAMTMATAPAPAAMPSPSPSGKTIGIIAGVVAGFVVLGVGGYFGYRMLFSGESSSRIATSEMPRSTAPALTPAPEPQKDAMPVPQPPPQDTASMKSAPAMPPDSGAKAATKGKDATAAASTTAPGSTAAPGAAAPKMDSGKAPPAKASNPPGPPGPPGSLLSTADVPGVTAQGRAPAQPDRWQQMREAMARCAGDNFFKRVACEQGVGQQYCEGFWGKVPQCPSGPPNKDRGQ